MRHSPWRWVRRSSSARALVIYTVLGLIANFPIWPGDPARIAACTCGGNKDPVQTAWFLAWTPFALLHGHNIFHTSYVNFPLGVNLAQNTGIPLLGLLTAPLTLAVSPVASENLLRFLAFPLSAIAMYAVLERWTRYAPAAFVGGLLYGFSPYMVGQASVHLDLSFVPLPPLILAILYEIVVGQRRSPLRSGLGLGVLAGAQFYISIEILATTMLTATVACVVLAVFRPRSLPSHTLHALAGLAIAASLAAVLCGYPVYLLTHGSQRYVGPSMGLNEVYNADLLGPVLPTSSQLVAPQRLVAIGSSLVGGLANVDENGSYLGLPLLLVVAWFTVRYWRVAWLRFALLVSVVMFVLSLGPRLLIDGRYYRLPFDLPFTAIRHLPLLDNLLPARLGLYVSLFVAVLVALGIAAHHDQTVLRRDASGARPATTPGGTSPARNTQAPGALQWVRRVGAGIVVVAAFVALLPRWPYRSVRATPLPAERPAALLAIPTGSAVLTYPYVTPETDVAMLWQALDGMRFKLLGSYMLRRGPTGGATQLPSGLKPYDVEALLADPLALDAVQIPKVPYLAPTTTTVDATSVVVEAPGGSASVGSPPLGGVVQNANMRTGSFYVVGSHGDLVGVLTGPFTHFVTSTGSPTSLSAIRRGQRVAVDGQVEHRGTIGKRRIADLRSFLRAQRVGAVLIELARHDSEEVVRWVRAAIGPPTRTGGGGAIWLDVQQDLDR